MKEQERKIQKIKPVNLLDFEPKKEDNSKLNQDDLDKLRSFKPKEIKNSSGHAIMPVKTLTNEAKQALGRVIMIENMEREKERMREREKKQEQVNHNTKVAKKT